MPGAEPVGRTSTPRAPHRGKVAHGLLGGSERWRRVLAETHRVTGEGRDDATPVWTFTRPG